MLLKKTVHQEPHEMALSEIETQPHDRLVLELDTDTQPRDIVLAKQPTFVPPNFFGLNRGQMTVGIFGITAVDMLVRDPSLMGISIMAGLLRLAYPRLKNSRYGKWAFHLLTAGGVAATGAMAMNLYTPPAHALFFQQAESFFSSTFDLSGEAISVIFNVFRAIYVIYLIYSAISVWSSYQRDEDWMSVAKAPIVIFIGGTMIDIVTQMIVA